MLEYVTGGVYGGPDSGSVVRNVNEETQAILVDDGLYWDFETNAANRSFIAHARTDVPRLVAEIERLKKELSYLTHECHTGKCDC